MILLSGSEKANLLQQPILKLNDTNVEVLVVTWDGPASHILMMKELGGNMSFQQLNPFFKHPETNYNISLLLHPCHMLKLIRGALFTDKYIKSKRFNN